VALVGIPTSAILLLISTYDELFAFEGNEPSRVQLPHLSAKAGFFLRDVRTFLGSKGLLKFKLTQEGALVANFVPGPPTQLLLALDVIVRSDARGLERMLRSALPHVDEIVVGVDERSDSETYEVAEAFADTVYKFGAADLGMTEEEWEKGRIHFANARNVGRAKVRSPWCLILDSDEVLQDAQDLREGIRAADARTNAFGLTVQVGDFSHLDGQRIARTEYRWTRSSHNQLAIPLDIPAQELKAAILHDTSLRSQKEHERRQLQRNDAVNDLYASVEAGDMNALYHLAKHRIGENNLVEAIPLVERFRLNLEVNGPAARERAHLAVGVGMIYFLREAWDEAQMWAVRALLDGPSIEAFSLLGDIAIKGEDTETALTWYEAACDTSATRGVLKQAISQRFERRNQLKKELGLI